LELTVSENPNEFDLEAMLAAIEASERQTEIGDAAIDKARAQAAAGVETRKQAEESNVVPLTFFESDIVVDGHLAEDESGTMPVLQDNSSTTPILFGEALQSSQAALESGARAILAANLQITSSRRNPIGGSVASAENVVETVSKISLKVGALYQQQITELEAQLKLAEDTAYQQKQKLEAKIEELEGDLKYARAVGESSDEQGAALEIRMLGLSKDLESMRSAAVEQEKAAQRRIGELEVALERVSSAKQEEEARLTQELKEVRDSAARAVEIARGELEEERNEASVERKRLDLELRDLKDKAAHVVELKAAVEEKDGVARQLADTLTESGKEFKQLTIEKQRLEDKFRQRKLALKLEVEKTANEARIAQETFTKQLEIVEADAKKAVEAVKERLKAVEERAQAENSALQRSLDDMILLKRSATDDLKEQRKILKVVTETFDLVERLKNENIERIEREHAENILKLERQLAERERVTQKVAQELTSALEQTKEHFEELVRKSALDLEAEKERTVAAVAEGKNNLADATARLIQLQLSLKSITRERDSAKDELGGFQEALKREEETVAERAKKDLEVNLAELIKRSEEKERELNAQLEKLQAELVKAQAEFTRRLEEIGEAAKSAAQEAETRLRGIEVRTQEEIADLKQQLRLANEVSEEIRIKLVAATISVSEAEGSVAKNLEGVRNELEGATSRAVELTEKIERIERESAERTDELARNLKEKERLAQEAQEQLIVQLRSVTAQAEATAEVAAEQLRKAQAEAIAEQERLSGELRKAEGRTEAAERELATAQREKNDTGQALEAEKVALVRVQEALVTLRQEKEAQFAIIEASRVELKEQAREAAERALAENPKPAPTEEIEVLQRQLKSLSKNKKQAEEKAKALKKELDVFREQKAMAIIRATVSASLVKISKPALADAATLTLRESSGDRARGSARRALFFTSGAQVANGDRRVFEQMTFLDEEEGFEAARGQQLTLISSS
jgi:hypothetical protein